MEKILQSNEKNRYNIFVNEDKIRVLFNKDHFLQNLIVFICTIVLVFLFFGNFKKFNLPILIILFFIFIVFIVKTFFINEIWEFNKKTRTWKMIIKNRLLNKEKIKTGNFNDFEILELWSNVFGDYAFGIYLRKKDGKKILLFSRLDLTIVRFEPKGVKESRRLIAEAILFLAEFFNLKFCFKKAWYNPLKDIKKEFPELVKSKWYEK